MHFTVLATLLAATANAHVGFWSNATFGFNFPNKDPMGPQNWNSNVIVVPLREKDKLTKSQWFAHGMLDYPPVPGAFFKINSGGKSTGELGSNRGHTTMRHPSGGDKPYYAPIDGHAVDGAYPGVYNEINNHNGNVVKPGAAVYGGPLNRTMFGGTAIGIAYNSNEREVQPEDFTIVSVDLMSPWNRLVDYNFPAGMPPCPAGGCLCTWNWIHKRRYGEGYGDEIFHNLFRCTVVGQTSTANVIPKGKVPVFCEVGNKHAASSCVKGPKQPMYPFVEGNNTRRPDYWGSENPTYTVDWGFADGAQNDAVVQK